MARLPARVSATATKAELEHVLARYRVFKFPDMYAGHEDDALFFVRHHEGPSRAQLLLTARCYGLIDEAAR